MEDAGVRPAVARVLGPTGEPAGAAFLVTPQLLLTAAHVVNLAAGADGLGTQPPGGDVVLDFVAAPGAPRRARVTRWLPPGAASPEDIAGLRLRQPAPPGVGPAPLTDLRPPLGRRVVTLGFPADAPQGGWGLGRLAAADARDLVQIDTLPESQFAVEQGFSGTPVWDVRDRAVAGLVVEGWTRGRRAGFMIPTSVLLTAWPELAEQVRPASPFPGLRSFTGRDAAVFFGRDELAERVVGLAAHAPAVTLVGPSGVGKSSLLHAGVVPRLRGRPDLVVATMRPSDAQTPLRALALALARAAEPDTDPLTRGGRVDDLADRLARGLVADVVGSVLERRGGERMLLVVDQLEEIFVADDPAPMAAALTHCLRPHARLGLLTCLRADFLGRVLQRRDLAELVQDVRLVTVGELSRSELRTAVEEPVRRTRLVRYEAGLVDRLLADVGPAPGRLPLLQFTLAMLWEEQESGELTHRAYDALGGVDSALARHAEAVWAGLGGPEQAAGARLLGQLLYPVVDASGFVARAAPRSELDEALWTTAQRLAAERARLVVMRTRDGGQVVELAHDALVTHWRRLGALGERDREFREWQESLRQRMRQWRRHGSPADRLLAGVDLRDALRWQAQRPADLAPAERAYLDLSARRRARRRWRWALRAAVVAAVVGMVAALLVRQEQVRVAHRAADAIIHNLPPADPYARLRSILRAYRTSATIDSQLQLDLAHAQYGRLDRVLPDYTGGTMRAADARWTAEPSAVAQQVSADGTTVVTTDPRHDVTVWRVRGDRVRGHPLHQVAIQVTVSRDGRYVGYLQDDVPVPGKGGPRNDCAGGRFCVALYDTATGERRRLGTIDSPGIPVIRFDPTGQVLAAAFTPDTKAGLYRPHVTTWGVASGRRRSDTRMSGGELDAVRDMWLAPGGRAALLEVAMPSHPGGRVVYDVLASAALVHPAARITVVTGDLDVSHVAVSGNGLRVAALLPLSRHIDPPPRQRLAVWDLTTGKVTTLPTLPAAQSIAGIALDRQGEGVYLTTRSGAPDTDTVRVWRLGRSAPEPTALHVPSDWQDVLPLGRPGSGPLALVDDDVLGLVLPAPHRSAPQTRLSVPLPSPDSGGAPDSARRRWADKLAAMLVSPVPGPGELTDLPAGAYTGPLG